MNNNKMLAFGITVAIEYCDNQKISNEARNP